MMSNINYLGILLCGVAAMVVGYFWYSKSLFGKTWMKEAGVSASQMKSANMMGMYVPMFIAALVEAYVLSVVLGMMGGALSFMSAATGAFWVWLGFIAATMLGGVLAEGRSMTYYSIVAGYHLVLIVIMSAILVVI